MTRITILLRGCGKVLLLLVVAAIADAAVPEFSNVRVFTVADSADKDLSGLALCDGVLYAIADKVDDTIYRVDIQGRVAALTIAQQVPAIPARDIVYKGTARLAYLYQQQTAGDKLDWEDIACRDGAIYLLSERKNAILKIAAGTATWLETNWYESAHAAGYLNSYNAFVEGIAIFDTDHIWIALEREPRGLLQLTRAADGSWQTRALPLGNQQGLQFRGDNQDVAGLYRRGNFLYTLERNASAICRRELVQLRAVSCYSFAAIENAPEYRYLNRRFGMAEGISMDEQWIYVVFDNNGSGFEHDPADRRALLLQIPMPVEWGK